jgi:hypothetical protein
MIIFFFFFFLVLGIERRVQAMLSPRSTTSYTSSSEKHL